MYDLDTFKVTHASKYPGPVLSLGISPDCGLLAVGQADGQLSIRKHSQPKIVPVEAGESALIIAYVPLWQWVAGFDGTKLVWVHCLHIGLLKCLCMIAFPDQVLSLCLE